MWTYFCPYLLLSHVGVNCPRRKGAIMKNLSLWKKACAVLVLCAAAAIASPAQTFTTLDSFNGANGSQPRTPLVQATDGNFYGATVFGGAKNYGAIFDTTTASGTLTALGSFDSTDGAYPYGGLVETANGNWYGTAATGGANTYGTVFEITPGGTLTALYNFCSQPDCTDGSNPYGGLIVATTGDWYGTTGYGGANGDGTVFKITPGGTLATLHSFTGTDGYFPFGGLIQATNGDLYGTTESGGANGYGTVFEITPGGTLTPLHSFDSTDGASPYAGLVQAANGDFYGTTESGGANGSGTVFTITPGGTLTTLYNFCSQSGCSDGAAPFAGLIQATDGNFYGTTAEGGLTTAECDYGCGTIFEITATTGTLTTLYRFCPQGGDCTDGIYPYVALMQATNGNFYGLTALGGATIRNGTIFSLSTGLGPFVETLPTSGEEGAKIGILGQGFSSSSVVGFGGVQATTVVPSGTTLLIATVPAGALTGAVTVTTGPTKLTSNQTFRVTPQLLGFMPPSGPVGTLVTITGVGLAQTLGVGFGDAIPATNLKIVSDTEVTVKVPTGAKTGPVGIETKGGIAIDYSTFTVTP